MRYSVHFLQALLACILLLGAQCSPAEFPLPPPRTLRILSLQPECDCTTHLSGSSKCQAPAILPPLTPVCRQRPGREGEAVGDEVIPRCLCLMALMTVLL